MGEAVAGDPRRVVLVEDGEFHSVKTDQPVERGEPQIPIGRLRHAAYAVLRQSVVGGVGVKAILRRQRRRACHYDNREQKPDWGKSLHRVPQKLSFDPSAPLIFDRAACRKKVWGFYRKTRISVISVSSCWEIVGLLVERT